MSLTGLIVAIALAIVHAFISTIKVDTYMPQYRWLSFAGGVSISYVFLDIFPELSQAQEEVSHANFLFLNYLENHVYLLALTGLVLFYGLDRLAFTARRWKVENNEHDRADSRIFAIHISAYALVNVIFGYLLQELSNHSLWQCILLFFAAALHFFIMDYTLREHHPFLYDRLGRWILTGSILVGAIAGHSLRLNAAVVAMVWAFLAGSILLNILKKELPEAQKTCFWSFLGGASLYAALIFLV
jgi:hypothetical protein